MHGLPTIIDYPTSDNARRLNRPQFCQKHLCHFLFFFCWSFSRDKVGTGDTNRKWAISMLRCSNHNHNCSVDKQTGSHCTCLQCTLLDWLLPGPAIAACTSSSCLLGYSVKQKEQSQVFQGCNITCFRGAAGICSRWVLKPFLAWWNGIIHTDEGHMLDYAQSGWNNHLSLLSVVKSLCAVEISANWDSYWLNLQNTIITNTIMQSILSGVGWKWTPCETHLSTISATHYSRERENVHIQQLLLSSLLHFITLNWPCIFISSWCYYYSMITLTATLICTSLRILPFISLRQLKWECIVFLCRNVSGTCCTSSLTLY